MGKLKNRKMKEWNDKWHDEMKKNLIVDSSFIYILHFSFHSSISQFLHSNILPFFIFSSSRGVAEDRGVILHSPLYRGVAEGRGVILHSPLFRGWPKAGVWSFIPLLHEGGRRPGCDPSFPSIQRGGRRPGCDSSIHTCYYDVAPMGLLCLYPERSRGAHIHNRLSSRLRSTNSLWSLGAVTRIPPQRGEIIIAPEGRNHNSPRGAKS